jgi:hypothetical protein
MPACVQVLQFLLEASLQNYEHVHQTSFYNLACYAGKLDVKQPAALRILSAFAGTYRDRSPSEVYDTLSSLFDNVNVTSIVKSSSSAPLDENKRSKLLALVKRGFLEGRFSDGKKDVLPDSWETELRTLLKDTNVQVCLVSPFH